LQSVTWMMPQKYTKAIKDATILQFQPLTDSADVQYTCISGKIHNKNVDTFNNIFHDVWRIFFKTYASVQNNIKRLFARIAGWVLQPRAIYMPQVNKPNKNIIVVAKNVLRCASELLPKVHSCSCPIILRYRQLWLLMANHSLPGFFQ
jgi:hypothetical protein